MPKSDHVLRLVCTSLREGYPRQFIVHWKHNISDWTTYDCFFFLEKLSRQIKKRGRLWKDRNTSLARLFQKEILVIKLAQSSTLHPVIIASANQQPQLVGKQPLGAGSNILKKSQSRRTTLNDYRYPYYHENMNKPEEFRSPDVQRRTSRTSMSPP